MYVHVQLYLIIIIILYFHFTTKNNNVPFLQFTPSLTEPFTF